MEEQNNIEDIFLSHGYTQGQEILINAEFLLGVLSFCRRVQDSQPRVAALLQYPSDVKVVKDKDSEEVTRVDIEWANHSKKSFSNTAFTENGGVPIITDLAMYALQIENALTETHLKNINDGVAVKFEEDGGRK
jgi:hypothetical protein